jgi:hypothetical protein
MVGYNIIFIAEGFIEYIAEKIVNLLHIYGDETKYIFYREYYIYQNEKIIEKIVKNYDKSEKVIIYKENFKEIYLENSNLVKDNNKLIMRNGVYLVITISLIAYVVFR